MKYIINYNLHQGIHVFTDEVTDEEIQIFYTHWYASATLSLCILIPEI